MSAAWTSLTATVLLFALAACAGPVKDAPAYLPAPPASDAAAPKPEYKKPIRMNGRGDVSSISLGDFFVLQQSGKALIYDARQSFFYRLGHIPGAINLSKNRCDEAIATREAEITAALAEGKTIVVYCSGFTCPDARTVAIHLSGFGYPAKIFAGGWDEWREAAMPAE